MTKKPIFLSLLTTLVATLASLAEATPYKTLEIDELSKKADLIVRGHVVSKTTRGDKDGDIYTVIELKVGEIWKGEHREPRLKIIQAGGILGDRRALITGQSHYKLGEQVLSFLVLNQRNEAVTLASSQGKFHLWRREKDGPLYAQNGLLGVPEKAADTNRHPSRFGASNPHPHPHPHPHEGDNVHSGLLKLTDLKHRVQESAK